MVFKRKIGLVFAGGGGKGSYELGVWKYLKEIGLTKKISVISGTSVGGLNAVLLSLCDYETAEWIWTTRLEGNILDVKSLKKKEWALFSRSGLLKIIDEYVNLDDITTLKKKIYVTCYNVNGLRTESFCLNDCDIKTIKKLLCATSAIPVIFRGELIDGNYYIDGGVGDNVPIDPLLYEKCTDAIIVNLNRSYHVDYSNYGINTIVIHPSTSLGDGFFDMLDFSSEYVEKRLELGYLDSKVTFAPIFKTLRGGFSIEDLKAKRINKMDDETVLQKALKKIVEDPELLEEIQGMFNIPFITAGGNFFWDDLAEYRGWRFQEHKFMSYVRLLDPTDLRLARGSRQQMIDFCRSILFGQL
ncbi:MAG: patatin-like phospholipase family protein [Spirochaetia bacterium]|nr:patatin-like phospholipase family protein [Spirochaetia bacterium]